MPRFELQVTPILDGSPQQSYAQHISGKDMTTAIRQYAERFLVTRDERKLIMLGRGTRVGTEMHYMIHKDTGPFQCSMLASIAVKNPPRVRSIYD